jgi:fatty-acyl-CoA synthase
MPTSQLKEMLDFFQIPYQNTHREYGATETVPFVVSILPGEDIARGFRPEATKKELMRVDSVGKPYLVEVRIIDENGNEVATGKVGEIIFKSEFTATGYWGNPELSKERFKNGWFYTNDLGVFDEDGYLYLKGRKDFMIKSGQFFVSPMEVENAILKHPAVREVAVIGIPNGKWGEAVKALICLKEKIPITEEVIRDHCRKYLAGFQVPKSVVFLETLPKDPQGKTDIKELIRVYTQ